MAVKTKSERQRTFIITIELVTLENLDKVSIPIEEITRLAKFEVKKFSLDRGYDVKVLFVREAEI